MFTYESCAFSARSTRTTRATIGNEDVYDLLRDSLRDATRSDRVGARGAMQCNGVDVEWRVGAATGVDSEPSFGIGK